jgi:hypothetical protein
VCAHCPKLNAVVCVGPRHLLLPILFRCGARLTSNRHHIRSQFIRIIDAILYFIIYDDYSVCMLFLWVPSTKYIKWVGKPSPFIPRYISSTSKLIEIKFDTGVCTVSWRTNLIWFVSIQYMLLYMSLTSIFLDFLSSYSCCKWFVHNIRYGPFEDQ